MGHELTSSGLRADKRKVETILNLPTPEDKKALHRVLGMATFLARYCAHFSEITSTLRELLHSRNEFRWDARHTEAFERLKAMLASAPVLAYFSPEKDIMVQCDASQSGLGAVIIQDGKVVEYASRALTDTEKNYAQIEKELLSIIWGLNRFDCYVYARRIVVQNDHRPLSAIHKKSLAAAPKRLQRMMLRLQRYIYELVYLPSNKMVLADTLSRVYLTTARESTSFHEELAAALSSVDADQMSDLKMIASPETIKRVTAAVKDDVEYDCSIKQITRGWPDTVDEVTSCIRAYYTFADERSLGVRCGLVFKGHRIVVPLLMRQYFLDRLHSAHTGVNGCLRRAKEAVYWPGMTRDIKQLVEACLVCVSFEQTTQ